MMTLLTATVTDTLVDKVRLTRKQIGTELLRREDELDIAFWSLLGAVHVFLLGSPGVAKSMLMERVTTYISDMRLFRKLLTPTTTPPEMVGPYDVGGLKDGHFRLITRGRLPEAHVGVIEETFKATSSLLNSLLMMMNERVIENDGAEQRIPLSSLWGNSNELPDDTFLLAFFDRFLFRKVVTPLTDWSDKRALLDLDIDPNPAPLLTWAEIEQAQAEVRSVLVSDDAKDALIAVLQKLHGSGIEPTDRRVRETLKVIRAAAWLEGEARATEVHLEPLVHVLWERPEQARLVQRTVLEVSSPGVQEALDVQDTIGEHVSELNAILDATPTRTGDRTSALMDLFSRMESDMESATRVRATAKGRAARIVEEAMDTLRVNAKRLFEANGIRSATPFT